MIPVPAVADRIGTEWHIKARHPTRITETSLDLGRKWYLAEFASEKDSITVHLAEQPHARFPVNERTNARTWSSPIVIATDQYVRGGELYAEGLYPSALEHFNSALYVYPQYANAWNDAGAALVQAGQLKDALDYYKHAVEADPKLVAARVNLSAVLADTGDLSGALIQAEEALRLDPKSTDAKMLIEKIRAKMQAK